ncbi:MAG: bordetella uptake protein [Betaproteobacteria bacterium]|nr:bordetella uptake protein [Betaproteobacteria bacterium]
MKKTMGGKAPRARAALCSTAALFVAAAASGGAIGSSEYPARPIRMVVPFAAGGVSDITARVLASRMQESLGQRLVIDNRGGAGGMIGTDIVAKAAPDGYTLVLASNGTHAVVPHLYKKVPYDPVKDFAPIGMVSISPQVLAVNKDLPVKSVKDLIALAKAKPGALTYGSSGNGSTGHISAEMLGAMAGIQLTHVPYKSASAAYPDVFSGRVALVFDSAYSMSQHIKADRLRALAVTTPKRAASLPDLPTMSEAGLPGYSMALWVAVFAPASTPAAIVARLNRDMNRALSTPQVREQMAQQGAEVVYGTPAELMAAVKGDLKRVGEIVKAANIEAQ